MSSLKTSARLHAAFASVMLTIAVPAASAQASADPDLKAISTYTLTMPKYQQYLDANVNIAKAASENPQLAGQLDGYGDKSLSEQIKLLDGIPPVKAAIADAGFTTRDYLLTQAALLQAGMAHAMTRDAKMPDDEVVQKAGVNKANLEFYRKNEAEINRLAKEAESRAPAGPDESE